jgi:hypothetical protein
VTLEIYLAAGLVVRATEEAETAAELAPKDPDARRLAAAVRKRK